jgi:hypothetical protein
MRFMQLLISRFLPTDLRFHLPQAALRPDMGIGGVDPCLVRGDRTFGLPVDEKTQALKLLRLVRQLAV